MVPGINDPEPIDPMTEMSDGDEKIDFSLTKSDRDQYFGGFMDQSVPFDSVDLCLVLSVLIIYGTVTMTVV